MGLREAILKSRVAPTETVVLGGETVYVRPMSGAQQESFSRANDSDESKILLRARLLVYSLCDTDGVNLFDEEDISALNELSGPDLERASDVALRVNGFTREAQEGLAKN